MATEWYRRKSWTQEDQTEFFAKLARARKDGRPQYLKIQAMELIATNDKQLLNIAESLLKKIFIDYPEDQFNKSSSLQSLGHIYKVRAEYNQALDYYKQTIDFEKIYPQVKTQAYLDYSELAIKLNKSKLFSFVENVLLERVNSNRLSFPIEEYKVYSLLAIIHKQKGDSEKANHYSDLAEIAAAKQNSGFRYHKDLGVVKSREKWIDKLLGLKKA